MASIPKEILKALRKIEIHTNRLANDNLIGTYSSSFRGQGLAFREVRPYQHGDDVRTIDWNVSARMNEPYIKVFVEEREMTVMLVVDRSRSEEFGSKRASKIRLASEVCAALAFSAIHKGDRVGLITSSSQVDKIIAPKKGDKHVMRVVREILTDPPRNPHPKDLHAKLDTTLGSATDLTGALESLVRVAKRRSIAFVVSDFFADNYERTLALAAAKHDLIPVVLADPRDKELPNVGLLTVQDLESGAEEIVDTSDPSVRASYARTIASVVEERRKLFTKLGLDSVEVSTNGSFIGPLRDLFARRVRKAR